MKIIRFALWALFTTWLVSIFYLASLPQKELPEILAVRFMDKVAHFFAFAMGGALLVAALQFGKRPFGIPRRYFAIAFILLIAVANEMYQLLIPSRSGADLADMSANTIGAVVGIFLCRKLLRIPYFQNLAPVNELD